MLEAFLPIMVLIAFALAFALGSVVFSRLVGEKKPNPVKLSPYECGTVKFYIIAMLFILFDIECVFLYPWAVVFKKLGMFGFIEMGVFIAILLVGYIYVWKKGALEWE